MMRILLTWLAFTAFTQGASAAGPIILYASDNNPPYSYVVNGEPAGIYVDILREALATMPDRIVRIQPVPRRRGLQETTTGIGRALGFFPAYTDDVPKDGRRRTMSAPLMKEETVVICSDEAFDSSPRRVWPTDYRGLRIGRGAGSMLGGQLEVLSPLKIEIEEGPGIRSNMLKMFRGRVDCVLTENLAFLLEMKAMEMDGEYDVTKAAPFSVGTTLGRDEAMIAYRPDTANSPEDADFIRRLDAALSAMARSYRTDEIVATRLR